MNIVKAIKGYKTIGFAAVEFIGGLVLALDPDWLVEAIEGRTHGYVMIGLSIVTLVLRIDTDSTIGRKF